MDVKQGICDGLSEVMKTKSLFHNPRDFALKNRHSTFYVKTQASTLEKAAHPRVSMVGSPRRGVGDTPCTQQTKANTLVVLQNRLLGRGGWDRDPSRFGGGHVDEDRLERHSPRDWFRGNQRRQLILISRG